MAQTRITYRLEYVKLGEPLLVEHAEGATVLAFDGVYQGGAGDDEKNFLLHFAVIEPVAEEP